MSLDTIIERCQRAGLTCVNICDHGTVEGALELQSIAPFKVIVSEEVLTDEGEIMGMFLKETIPSHISVDEAISRIREQDGLVCLPHPFDPLRGFRRNGQQMEKLAEHLDVVEVFNARSPFLGPERKARKFAGRHNLPGTLGSDSHYPTEIGRSWVELPDFETKAEFLTALRKGRMHKRRSSPLVHFHSTWARLKKLF